MKNLLRYLTSTALGVGLLFNIAKAETLLVPSQYSTIQSAIDASHNGDEIIVQPGRYIENINFKGRNIVLRSVNPLDSNVIANSVISGGVTFTSNEGPIDNFNGIAINGTHPVSVAIGDADNDGKNEIVTANQSSDDISFLRWNGIGFDSPRNIFAGSKPTTVVIADADNDGKNEIVTANYTGNNVSLLRWNGTGFDSPVTFPTNNYPYSVAVGDLNNDDKNDIVTAHTVAGTISLLLWNGTGFNSYISMKAGDYSEGLVIADANNDGYNDVVVANSAHDYMVPRAVVSNISLFKGNGTNLDAQIQLSAGHHIDSVAVGDADNDGDNDIVCTNRNDNNISLLRWNGIGFDSPVNFSTGTYPMSVAIGDADNDQYNDIVTANSTSNNISFLRWNETGFDSPLNIPVGTTPVSVAIGDANNDGYNEIITANANSNNISLIYVNRLIPTPTPDLTKTCTLEGFTISESSRGILCQNSSPTISYCNVTNNTHYGQSAYVQLIRLPLGGTYIAVPHPAEPTYGGGIFAENSSMIIKNCTIQNNYIKAGNGYYFNLYGFDQLLLPPKNAYGGGLYFVNSKPIISNTIIKSNVCIGGTFENYDSQGIGFGSGIYAKDSTITLENCIINENQATGGNGQGWGLFFDNSDGKIINCSVSKNKGGSGIIYGFNGEIKNNIIWANNGDQIAGSVTPSYSNIQNWTQGGEGNISSDPQFVDSTNNNFHLKPTSPCIDAGTTIEDLLYDFEGDSRPYGEAFDIGADEYIPKRNAVENWNLYE
ncbi:MAG: FG-GAP-like repeat-containing protein [Candidatus Pacearchaeota archaeon]